jgi:hypothetical protein
MHKINIFSINFYQFSCIDTLTNRILNKVKSLDWIHNNVSSDDLFFDDELFLWFEECLDKVRKELGLSSDIKLPIISCRANKTSKLQAHHIRSCNNSFISGIFYLTDHDSSHTQFYYKNYWLQGLSNYKFKHSIPNLQYKFLPIKSTLILFPSHIEHSVITQKQNENRYTIAFNTYLSGEIDDGDNRCRLHIIPKSVRDHYNET